MTSIPGNSIRIREFTNAARLQKEDLNFNNLIIHSKLSRFDKRVDDSGLSIKCTLSGAEEYLIHGVHHVVRPGQFLIVNKHQSFDCSIASKKPAEAYCFYLDPSIVKEVDRHLHSSLEDQLAGPGERGSEMPVFLEKVYSLTENSLGQFLQQLLPRLQRRKGSTAYWNDVFFYDLAHHLCQANQRIVSQIKRIPSAKATTREELFKRLSIARNMIMDQYDHPIQLDELARVAAISKFHLLRTFKQVYGTTPYQMVLKRRLERAKDLIQEGQALENIAFDIGFSDRRSFTKAFKKVYQKSPSEFRQKIRVN